MKRLILIVLALFISACAALPSPEIGAVRAEFYFKRGCSWHEEGEYGKAFADYTKAIELNPKLAGAYLNRGAAYYFKGEYEKAWEDVHKLQSLGHQVKPEFLKALRKALERQIWNRWLIYTSGRTKSF